MDFYTIVYNNSGVINMDNNYFDSAETALSYIRNVFKITHEGDKTRRIVPIQTGTKTIGYVLKSDNYGAISARIHHFNKNNHWTHGIMN